MTEEPTPRVVVPSLLAGPAVILFLIAAEWTRLFTSPIELSPAAPFALLLLLPIAAGVGVVPALVANLIGTFVLIKLGNWFPLLRFPLLWALVGGSLAWAAVRYLEFGAEWTFAYAAAGALSALICRMRLA